MNPLLIGPIAELGSKIIDKLFPDKEKHAVERAEAEFKLAQLAQDGTLKTLSVQMSAIVAEAQSTDPWTSRARPSFLYVIYIYILMGIPMGFLSAYKPEMAEAVANGVALWLDAMPNELYALFGVGYLGYTGARMWEKRKKGS